MAADSVVRSISSGARAGEPRRLRPIEPSVEPAVEAEPDTRSARRSGWRDEYSPSSADSHRSRRVNSTLWPPRSKTPPTPEEMRADVEAAKAAFKAWKSDDASGWTDALRERRRIQVYNPEAWAQAMAELGEGVGHPPSPGVGQPPHVPAPPPPPAPAQPSCPPAGQAPQEPGEVKLGELPGYSPHSRLAPPPPASPAFDAAYRRPKPKFYGVDLGIVKLGVNSRGSIEAGVNVGIAKAGVQVGVENRVEADFMPYGGPLHARAGAGIGINRQGLHAEVGAGANVFDVVNGDADVGARIGPDTGIDADVRGKVWPLHAQGDAGASVGLRGAHAYTGSNAGIADAIGVRSGARFDLDKDDLGASTGVGLKAGDKTLDFGPSLETDGYSTVRPRLHLERGSAGSETFYPTGDRTIDRDWDDPD